MVYLPGDKLTDTKIAEILSALADGKWHTRKEILEKTKLKPRQLETVIKFLEEYGFVTVNATEDIVRLNENFRKLLVQEPSQ